VGIAMFPDDAVTVEVLLQRADVAMYLAKQRRTGVETYVARADHYSPARLSLLGDLRRGIDRGEFELHYQPKVFLATGQAAGMEALLRWQHPDRGLLGPSEFIPLAEQSFLMRELTVHVVQLALRQASAWRRSGLAVQLSVNVSRRDLLGAGLAATIERELAGHGLPPGVLLLEISERALNREAADIAAGLNALRALGIELSVDDFMTGYCSVGRLKEMSIGEVKIDPSFIAAVASSPDTELIVRSAVHLLRGLGIRSVAEGVESPQVAASLRAMGCDVAQGWQFSRPLNAAAAAAWLARRHPAPAPAPGASWPAPATGASGPVAAPGASGAVAAAGSPGAVAATGASGPVAATGSPGAVAAAGASGPGPATAAPGPVAAAATRLAPATMPASAATPPPGSMPAPDPRAGGLPAAAAPASVPEGDCLDAAARP
jgi:EAL domain-containing protein (putative c-di-GMP-specific phosphodiesterase class I)